MANFKARYRLTLDDYAAMSEACTRLTRARRIGRIMRYALDAALFALAAVYAYRGEWGFAACFVALGLFVVAVRFIGEPWQRRRQFREQRVGEAEVDFTADDEGVASSSEHGHGALKWNAIHHVDDLPAQVVLWPNVRIGFIVPKRAFATPAEAAAFAKFAKEKTVDQKL